MHLKMESILGTRPVSWLVAAFSLLALAPSDARAEVVRDDSPKLEGSFEGRAYQWKDTGVKPKAVALAVHGLVLHGGVYDKMARELASQGFVVVAPDLRGYGRWCPDKPSRHGCTARLDNAAVVPLDDSPPQQAVEEAWPSCKNSLVKRSKISYNKSYGDLKELVKSIRNQYPALPLYVIGESLGAGMAMHLAADMPQSIDGLVLSSPAIKRRMYMEPRMVMDLTAMMMRPSKQIDLVPYIKRFASEDPDVVCTALQDPLVRKRLTVVDLLKTSQLIKGNIKYANRIPDSMPVLIIQGDRDRMLKSNGVVTLLDHLKSQDQTVKWLSGKGHLLLETPHIMPETMATVSNWLSDHVQQAAPRKAGLDSEIGDDIN